MASDSEQVKQRDEVIQESKEEPATSSEVTQPARSFEENSICYKTVSRVKENNIKQLVAEVEGFADVSERASEKLGNCGRNIDQDFPAETSSLWTTERGSKLVSTYENKMTQVNCCGEQNIGAISRPRSETSLFGARIGSSEVHRVIQPDSSSQQTIKENGIAKRKIGARIPPWIGASEIAWQARQQPQKSVMQVDEVNKEQVVSGESDEAAGSRRQAKVRTLDTEYGISREVLEQHSAKKLEDVAVVLGVSRSTLKRICRKCGIFRWPPSKARRHNNQEFVQATRGTIEESSQMQQQPISDVVSVEPRQERDPLKSQVENVSTSQMQTTTEAKVVQEDDRSIMVKVTCKDDIIKFRLLVSARKVDLEQEVAMRLNLTVGSFKIKYLDEDGDWVLITCDVDLKICISTSISLGKTTIKMLIEEVASHNPTRY